MMSFCGQVLRVQDRVENIILEATPRQRKIKDTVLLEERHATASATVSARVNRFFSFESVGSKECREDLGYG